MIIWVRLVQLLLLSLANNENIVFHLTFIVDENHIKKGYIILLTI